MHNFVPPCYEYFAESIPIFQQPIDIKIQRGYYVGRFFKNYW